MSLTWPSRKWIAAQVTAVGALLAALIQNGWELTTDLQLVLLGIVVQAIATYLVPDATSQAAAESPAARRAVARATG